VVRILVHAVGELVVEAQIDDCFTEDPETLWRNVLRRHGGAIAVFALQPDDPSLN
jgi:putative transcriptional regulator